MPDDAEFYIDPNSDMVEAEGFEEEDEGHEIEEPFDPTKIDIVDRRITVSSLLERLKNSELDLTPDFQRRANIWDDRRKSRLIESVLLRIPLPSFYFSEDSKGIYSVVDGLQRLCAIFHFLSYSELNKATGSMVNPMRLKDLQYLKELEGKAFSELDRGLQRRIQELEITVNNIRPSTPPAVKFNVFARLNQGGMPLNAQEIRNAICPGPWRNHIRRIAEGPIFIRATEGRIAKSRQADMELVLRFAALWSIGSSFERKKLQNLDEFLNEVVVETFPSWAGPRWFELENIFGITCERAVEIFSRHIFRKSAGTDGSRTPINRGLFESELITLAEIDEDEFDRLKALKDMFLEKLAEKLKIDQRFSSALLYSTGSAEASNTRISTLRALIREVLDAQKMES